MSIVSLSLPQKQIEKIDELINRYGFGNRSEFIRTLLRFVLTNPDIIEGSSYYPFVSPKERSVRKIVSDFQKTKKYSRAFLKDLEKGLSQSNYFEK